MNPKFKVIHSIPGRIRICIPLLANIEEYTIIEELMGSIAGIKEVKIEGITQSMLVYYDADKMRVKDVLHFVGLISLFIEKVNHSENHLHHDGKSTILQKLVDLWLNAVFRVEKQAENHLNIPDYVNSVTSLLNVLTKFKKNE